MKTRALAAALSVLLPVLAASPAAAALTLSKLEGEVSIKTSRGVVTVKAGDPAPAIPEGAQITVVSGKASFTANGVVVSASAGSAFTYAEGRNGVQISANAGSVTVAAGRSAAVLPAGAAVAVKVGKETVVIAVTAGQVPVTTDGKTETIPAGKFASSAAPAPATKGAAAAAPDSLPAVNNNTFSPVQEKQTSTCDTTVSPSAPCN